MYFRCNSLLKLRPILTLVLAVIIVNSAPSQTFVPRPPTPSDPNIPPSITINNLNTNNNSNQAVVSNQPAYHPAEEPPIFGMHLMLGQLLGLRGQFAMTRSPGFEWILEGFYGGSFSRLGSSDAVAAGVRANIRRSSRNGVDTIIVGPGCNLMYNLRDGQALYLNPSLDISWVGCFQDWRCAGWELGVNLGLGIGISGHDGDGNSAGGKVTPLLGVFGGVRF